MPKYNPNRAKINRSYTFEELAELFGVHKNTIAAWVKNGLHCLKDKRPYLILGSDVKAYLQQQRRQQKKRCKQDELYCMRCRQPTKPAENFVEYIPVSITKGRLTGFCSVCEGVVNQFVGVASLGRYAVLFDLSVPKELEHIRESKKPLVNSDFQ